VVLDSAAYAATMADIDAARSEAATAHDNYQRLQGLYSDDGNASRQAVETADTQLSTAHARVATAEARARSEWGAQLVDAGNAQSTLRRDLANGRVALLRAEFANALPGASDQLEYALLTSDPGDSALHPLVFLARSSAPAQAAGGPSVLLRLKGEGGNLVLRPGARFPVIAALSSGPDRPVVPAAAALADGGQFWCYVARDGGKFERVPLASIERVAGGYPVAAGVKAGDQVVVRGAPLLLSLERGAGSVAEAE
jgi:multidrug efflux pump subunit AcrA (membrane-fusion protein)